MYFVFSQNFARRGGSETFFYRRLLRLLFLLPSPFSNFSSFLNSSYKELFVLAPTTLPSSSSSSSSSCVFFGWRRWILYTKGQLRGTARCGGMSRVGRSACGCGCGHRERWKPAGVTDTVGCCRCCHYCASAAGSPRLDSWPRKRPSRSDHPAAYVCRQARQTSMQALILAIAARPAAAPGICICYLMRCDVLVAWDGMGWNRGSGME